MELPSRISTTTSQEQLRIKANGLHPSGKFVEFTKEELEQAIPPCFERSARMHKERIALKNGNLVYTYDSLNKAANTLAHVLLESSQQFVAFLSDSTHGVVCILAILKAGKSYVGLDPVTPVERNAFYLRNAGVDFLITDHEHFSAARALVQDGQRIINLDELGPENGANLGIDISPDAVAGIFYTSGSTGEPKGVIQSHRNILHDTLIRVNDHHFCAEDRIALTQSLSFSGSVRTIFPALLIGAALFPYDIRKNTVADYGLWVDKERITYMGIRRQLLGAFAALRDPPYTFSHLRWIHLGGELVYGSDIETLKNHIPGPWTLHVNYSSTEAGAIARYLVDKRSAVDKAAPAPVGYPCDDTEVCLVDDNGHEVATGEVGEIVVKSRYLSPGYWNRPDLTNRVFSADPQDSQRRSYRTGDLGRFSPEGCLLHLGRNDSQIKIRGYRIEIAEVEQRLLEHPSVQHALVKSFTQENGDNRLVGYVVAADGTKLTTSDVRRHMGTRLAEYMIPSTFVSMAAFPTDINGKFDRNALPAPDRTRPELDEAYCPPNTLLERQLAQIWRDLLQLDRVGIHDNFFELGGHSLLATQLVNRIRESLQIAVPVNVLFESSTISHFIEVIETMNWLAEKPNTLDPGDSESETF